IRSMCEASTKANVGPMASVAGAVALAGLKGATEAGSSHCIVDNGGDIAMILERPVSVGILDQIESDLVPAFQLPPTSGRIVGLCTSSGVFGHSISFGLAEAASVMAHNPILADALATSLGNSCKDEESMIAALEAMRGIEDVIWAMAIVGERIGTMGEIPRMIQGVRSKNNITVHSDFRASISHH
ncbi:MAG: UPF0280 family protein, partial [Thermoplasmata archaeon]|nr:UPF0280 family protein [Thermoplasmata archaeon]